MHPFDVLVAIITTKGAARVVAPEVGHTTTITRTVVTRVPVLLSFTETCLLSFHFFPCALECVVCLRVSATIPSPSYLLFPFSSLPLRLDPSYPIVVRCVSDSVVGNTLYSSSEWRFRLEESVSLQPTVPTANETWSISPSRSRVRV